MTISKILAAITKAAPLTAAQLRDEMGKIDMAALEARVAELERERRELLLRGSDADLEKNTKALAAAKLDVERAETLLDELIRLAREADAREAAEAFEAEHAVAIKAKEAFEKAIADGEMVATQLKVHIDEATAAADVVAKWNRKVGPASPGQPARHILQVTPEIAKQRLLRGLR